ncbi:flagellar basal-body rod protein FlgF [Pelagibius litoralis]|uniref:Flagellar basal-body rod protein FlgF n=1 Tax=Pelagibius litoralis TaxID=374515 RepID=A0A967EXX8_9PROT|nr:flagellar basal-body rod protein FlgF [Pelagibius litoralis]NIA69452.1 flagellar basal-body rod protein FlgF [Pelagibius litoralis]
MENAGYIALSRQMVLRREMDVIANNMANLNTPAYKGESMLFVEYLEKTDSGEKMSFVQDIGLVRNLTEGNLSATDNPLDTAISGDAYYEVETPLGPRYTRNGAFRLNAEGELITVNGDKVLGDGGNPITLPPNSRDVTITRDGTVSTDQGPAGKIRLARFENEQALIKQANGLYEADGQDALPAEGSEVVQGMVEDSNVAGIIEMTKMIATVRSYSSTGRMVNNEHERLRRAIQALGSPAR